MKIAVLILIHAGASVSVLQADTNVAESNIFGVDARDLGNAASSSSSVFALGTQSGNLDALVIDVSAPGSVIAGQEYAFPVWASFAGSSGSLIDVSKAATWFIVGDAPGGTRFEGNKLIAGDVTEPTVIKVSAVFTFPSGAREAVPIEVTIHPANPAYKIVVVYASELGTLDGNFIYTLSCNAATDGPQGAAQPQNVLWDLDQDGEFDDGSGLLVESTPHIAGKTIRIGVRAEWPLGDGSPVTAINYFYVTFEQPYAVEEPPRGRAVDILNGSFMDSTGGPIVPDEMSKENGLVVLTHGLWGAGTDTWLGEMRNAILARPNLATPNVVIYDWEKMSDPTEYRTNGRSIGQGSGVWQIDDFYDIRPYGESQGVMIADWIDRQRQLGRVDRSAKIHLIGHSAGGFAVGECARLLQQRLYSKVQVTMLDTPLPYHTHIKPEWRTERYISSYLGGRATESWHGLAWNTGSDIVGSKVDKFIYDRPATFPAGLDLLDGTSPRKRILLKALVQPSSSYYRAVINPHQVGVFKQHSASHDYYLATISESEQSVSHWAGEGRLGDGFNQSFLVDGSDFISAPQAMLAAVPLTSQAGVPAIDDFFIFGDVQQNGSVYQVTEVANAGIFKTMNLPAAVATLEFQLQVTTPGDGDFVSVHWNDGDALAIIPETSLAYDAPLTHEVDLTGLGGQTGTLTLKLISRGDANSVVEFSEVKLLESDDLDGDGLSNTAEGLAGSDPLLIDTDGDGLTDAEEVQVHGTSPAARDSDGDQQNDASELAAGTDPLDPQSWFANVMGPVTPGVSASVFWNGVAGRSYRVVRSSELGTFNIDYLEAGRIGVDGPMNYVDPNPPTDKAFYWIEVE